MNDNNSVPARIVIFGTSTMKLSDRFSRLDGSPSKHYGSSSGRLDRGRSVASPDMSGAYGGMMSNRFAEPRSFLFDDYMDNDLFGTGRVDQQVSGLRLSGGGGRARGRGQRNYNNDYTNLDDGNDYETYERAPRYGEPRGRPSARAGPAETRYVMVPMDSIRPHRRPVPRARAETVQEVYEYYELPHPMRRGKPKIVKKVPIQNRISFKRQQRSLNAQRPRGVTGRNAAIRQTPMKKQQTGGFANRHKAFVTGGVNNTRSPLKKRPKVRPKATVEELNRDLESYMRSGKHPRIEASA